MAPCQPAGWLLASCWPLASLLSQGHRREQRRHRLLHGTRVRATIKLMTARRRRHGDERREDQQDGTSATMGVIHRDILGGDRRWP